MKGAIVHGGLLVAMLLLAYQSWTREAPDPKKKKVDHGSVELWTVKPDALESLVYTTPERTVKLERRGDAGAYFWGTDTKQTKKAKAKPPTPDAGVPTDAGVATDGGVPPAPEPPEMETVTVVREFPIGEAADELVKGFTTMRALTNLGALSDEQKAEYEFKDDTTLAVVLSGKTHTFVLGDKVYSGKDRYVLDVDSGVGYVLAGALIEPIEGGENSLKPKKIVPDLKDETVATVEITAGDKTRSVSRITAEDENGKAVKTWGDKATSKADQATANFLTKVETSLKPQKFDPALDVTKLPNLVTVTYRDAHGKELGVLSLYKQDHPTPSTEGTPPETGPAYWVMSTGTRVPAQVQPTSGDQVEQQIAGVFQ